MQSNDPSTHLFDAELSSTALANGIDAGNLCGKIKMIPFKTKPNGEVDDLASMMSRCKLDDACVILNKYMNLPLLFTQRECNRDGLGRFVSRQCRTYVAKARKDQETAALERERRNKEKGRRVLKNTFRQPRDPDAGLNNRGWISVAPHSFFGNSCKEEHGRVLRSATVIASGPVGYITNMTVQPIMQDASATGGGICFSDAAPCKCCGIVPTNMATCILGGRKQTSNMKCIRSAVEEFGKSFSAHEEFFKTQHGLDPDAWSNCEECSFYFNNVKDATAAFNSALDVLEDRFTQEELIGAFDCVLQHEFKDSIDIKVHNLKETPHACTPSCLIDQIGPLCQVVEGKDTYDLKEGSEEMHKYLCHKRLRLLENVVIHSFDSDGKISTNEYEAGTVVEFPTDSNTVGTRVPDLDTVRGIDGHASDVNLRRRTAASVGDIVRCSMHPREPSVDEYRVSKALVQEYESLGARDCANVIPILVANLVLPTSVELYQEWQKRALEGYAKMELINVVSEGIPECTQHARRMIVEEAMPDDPTLVEKMKELHQKGAPLVTSLPLSQLCGLSRAHRQSYHAGVAMYTQLMDKDQSFSMHVIDRWLNDWKANHDSENTKSEAEMLGEIYHLLSNTYVHGSGKYSDLDQFLVPLKLRMGIFNGVSRVGKQSTAGMRREWRCLEIRGDHLPDNTESAMSKFIEYKYERLKGEGPYR